MNLPKTQRTGTLLIVAINLPLSSCEGILGSKCDHQVAVENYGDYGNDLNLFKRKKPDG